MIRFFKSYTILITQCKLSSNSVPISTLFHLFKEIMFTIMTISLPLSQAVVVEVYGRRECYSIAIQSRSVCGGRRQATNVTHTTIASRTLVLLDGFSDTMLKHGSMFTQYLPITFYSSNWKIALHISVWWWDQSSLTFAGYWRVIAFNWND